MRSMVLDVQSAARGFDERSQVVLEKAQAGADTCRMVGSQALSVPTQSPLSSFDSRSWRRCAACMHFDNVNACVRARFGNAVARAAALWKCLSARASSMLLHASAHIFTMSTRARMRANKTQLTCVC